MSEIVSEFERGFAGLKGILAIGDMFVNRHSSSCVVGNPNLSKRARPSFRIAFNQE
jgi:hypothetical protein